MGSRPFRFTTLVPHERNAKGYRHAIKIDGTLGKVIEQLISAPQQPFFPIHFQKKTINANEGRSRPQKCPDGSQVQRFICRCGSEFVAERLGTAYLILHL